MFSGWSGFYSKLLSLFKYSFSPLPYRQTERDKEREREKDRQKSAESRFLKIFTFRHKTCTLGTTTWRCKMGVHALSLSLSHTHTHTHTPSLKYTMDFGFTGCAVQKRPTFLAWVCIHALLHYFGFSHSWTSRREICSVPSLKLDCFSLKVKFVLFCNLNI